MSPDLDSPTNAAVESAAQSQPATRHRLAVVCSHAIQYFMPWFRVLSMHPRLQVTVLLGDGHGLDGASFDPGFGRPVRWDSPLTEGIDVLRLQNRSPRPGVGRFSGVINPELWSLLRPERFDAVLIHGWNYALYPMALAAARAHGLPVLLRGESPLLPPESSAAPPPPRDALGRLRRAARDAVLRRYVGACAAGLAVSSGNRRLLLSLGLPANRVFFTPYTVDTARFTLPAEDAAAARAEQRAALQLDDTTPLILFVGKLQAVKQPERLLSAYAALRAAGTRAALAFAGDGELLPRLREAAARVPDVHFLGFLNQSQLPRLYPAADVFVLPSHSETFGLVLIEAMLAGLPVIASDGVGCAEDLVTADTGLCFPRGDTAALTAALSTLCGDAALRARLSAGARARVATWTYERATDGLLAALDTVRSGPRHNT